MLKKIITATTILLILAPSISIAATNRPLTIANDWATAAKERNGKKQYQLLCKDQKKKNYADLKELNWVTGVSSPQIGSYTIVPSQQNKNEFLVKYQIILNDKAIGSVTDTLQIKNNCIAKFNYLSPSGVDAS